ncbi:MAG: helix-turn-helix domain-containing protein [Gammaproteobacteria bacterium]|nr:helix-turn-helix domain-containing protein [Gammaproteobacteria bacterium]MDH5694608.1 helix-turn-helix domain-containing protein [Gammaproteobacteria bacterium]
MARKITEKALPESPVVDSLETFGAFIRSLRSRQQLRIDDAAALCGVSVQLLSDLENGKRSVGLDKALSIAQQMGLSLLAIPKSELPRTIANLKTKAP